MNIKTPITIILLSILGIILTAMMSSCSSSRVPNTHTPSKREIRKAMRYSTSEYAIPMVESNTGAVSRSRFCFHPGK